jgi:hypothetical protein
MSSSSTKIVHHLGPRIQLIISNTTENLSCVPSLRAAWPPCINCLFSFRQKHRCLRFFLWVRFPTGAGHFLFTIASRLASGPSQPPTKCVSRAVSNLPPCGAEFKNAWSFIYSSPYIFLVWCLSKRTTLYLHRLLRRWTFIHISASQTCSGHE